MPLTPTNLLLAKNPARQAVYGFKKNQEVAAPKSSIEPPSYNAILNSGATSPKGKDRWIKIKKTLDKTFQNGHYRPYKNVFFAYEIEPHPSRIGIIGTITANKLHHRVKIHEAINPDRVSTFSAYLKIVGIQAEPCVIAFKEQESWRKIETAIRDLPILDRFTIMGETHKIWLIQHEQKTIFDSLNTFFNTPNRQYVLIDGHHRKAAIHKLSLTKKSPSI